MAPIATHKLCCYSKKVSTTIWTLWMNTINNMNNMNKVAVNLYFGGFPGGPAVKNLPANSGDDGSNPGSRRFPWKQKWQPTPVFLPGKAHEQRSLEGYSSWCCKRVRHNLGTKNNKPLFIKTDNGVNLAWATACWLLEYNNHTLRASS